jgi:hypothetical protein
LINRVSIEERPAVVATRPCIGDIAFSRNREFLKYPQIDGLKMCLDNKESRLKGAHIWGSKLNLDGSLTPFHGSSKFERYLG